MRKRICGMLVLTALALAGCGGEPMPPTVEGKLDKAVREVSVYSFDRARPLFNAAREQAQPNSPEWIQATFGAAVCAQHVMPASANTIAEAEELFNAVIKADPASDYAARATMNLGRIAELVDFKDDPSDLEKARAHYRRVIDAWPGKEIADEATLRLAATYVQTYDQKQVREGIAILEKHLAAAPANPLASAMWQYVGDAYFNPLEDYKAALAAYENCDRLGWMQKGREGPMYWRIAVIADRKLEPPDRATAVRYYTKIIKETPTSGKAYESQLALKRLGAPVPEIELFTAPSASAPATQNAMTPTASSSGEVQP